MLEQSESCDGMDFGAEDCTDYGFDGGLLACDASCEVLTSACNACGDGTIDTNDGEECEPGDVASTCEGEGFDGPQLPHFCHAPPTTPHTTSPYRRCARPHGKAKQRATKQGWARVARTQTRREEGEGRHLG